MNIVIKRSFLKNTLFYIPYVIYLLYSLINTSFYAKYVSSYGKILLLICFLLLIIREAIDFKLNYREGILAIVLILVIFIFILESISHYFLYLFTLLGILILIRFLGFHIKLACLCYYLLFLVVIWG